MRGRFHQNSSFPMCKAKFIISVKARYPSQLLAQRMLNTQMSSEILPGHEMVSEDTYSSSSEGGNDSDAEEQPRAGHQNKESLLKILEEIQSNVKWVETLSVSTDTKGVELPSSGEADNKLNSGSVHDDFKRELGFYCQAQAAAKEALSKLRDLGIPTERPEDYFAEMVKTDTHMQKVRSRLQSIKVMKETAEKKKKMRQMKKFGKKVQQEVLEKRKEEKKQMLKEVNRIRKGKRKLEDKPGEDIFDVNTESFSKGNERNRNIKRKKKNEKYGFGGKKRMLKKNSAASSGDASSFNPAKHGKGPKMQKPGGQKKKQLKRLGKARRVKQKIKKK